MKDFPPPREGRTPRSRADSARSAVASAEMENLTVDADTQALIRDWVEGKITDEAAIERARESSAKRPQVRSGKD